MRVSQIFRNFVGRHRIGISLVWSQHLALLLTAAGGSVIL